MKIPEIKRLVGSFSREELVQAEEQIANEEEPTINVTGDDEGEKLTHVLAAIYIMDKMNEGMEFKSALRDYTGKVRESING
ncbi:MAG: hypothetical protein MJA30_00170 [Cytophagales bacterium]|nr:hypothetical protein [Cytophagales bacterium]